MSRHPTARRAVAGVGPLRRERLAAVLAEHRLAHGLGPLLSPSSVVVLAAGIRVGLGALRAAEVQPGRPAMNPQRGGREGERRGLDELACLRPASVAAEVVVHEHAVTLTRSLRIPSDRNVFRWVTLPPCRVKRFAARDDLDAVPADADDPLGDDHPIGSDGDELLGSQRWLSHISP